MDRIRYIACFSDQFAWEGRKNLGDLRCVWVNRDVCDCLPLVYGESQL